MLLPHSRSQCRRLPGILKSLKRSLGAFQLTLLGIGAVIGTGIFVLTATAAQKAGPGMMISFIVSGVVCALAALCYSELASMVPVASGLLRHELFVSLPASNQALLRKTCDLDLAPIQALGSCRK